MEEQDVKELNEEIELDKIRESNQERISAIKDKWKEENLNRLRRDYFGNVNTFNSFDYLCDFIDSVWEQEKEDYI